MKDEGIKFKVGLLGAVAEHRVSVYLFRWIWR